MNDTLLFWTGQLVREGVSCWLPRDLDTGREVHTLPTVMSEMVLQVCSDYPGIPDYRTLTFEQIEWFYNGLRESLKEATKPRKT